MSRRQDYIDAPEYGGSYSVKRYGGIAWRVLGYHVEWTIDGYSETCDRCGGDGLLSDDEGEEETCKYCDGNGAVWIEDDEPTAHPTGDLVCRMVGDDQNFRHDPSDLTELKRSEYCGECGQIGCSHDGYSEEE